MTVLTDLLMGIAEAIQWFHFTSNRLIDLNEYGLLCYTRNNRFGCKVKSNSAKMTSAKNSKLNYLI